MYQEIKRKHYNFPVHFEMYKKILTDTHTKTSDRIYKSSFSIIRYFLPNSGRILSVVMEESKIKIAMGLNPQPPDHHSNALPTELSHYLVACVKH